jgi:hypothetical protein
MSKKTIQVCRLIIQCTEAPIYGGNTTIEYVLGHSLQTTLSLRQARASESVQHTST